MVRRYLDYLEKLHNVKWKFIVKLRGLEGGAWVVNQTDEIHFGVFWGWMLRYWRVQQLPLLREKSDKKVMSLIKSSEGQSSFFPLLFFFSMFLSTISIYTAYSRTIFSFYSRKWLRVPPMSSSVTRRTFLICMCHCYLVIVPVTIVDFCLCLYRFCKELKPMYLHVSWRFLRLDSCATHDI